MEKAKLTPNQLIEKLEKRHAVLLDEYSKSNANNVVMQMYRTQMHDILEQIQDLKDLISDNVTEIESFKMHRHNNNPKEKEIYEKFKKEHLKDYDLDTIVFGHGNNSFTPNDFLSNREKSIVMSTIQWLGSPVGQYFLQECGFRPYQEEAK